MSTAQVNGQADGYWRRSRPSRPRKLAFLVAQQIVAEICENQYSAGTKLPAEREMLGQYGVARGTLREALRFLEMNGVITVRPGPGGGPTVVSPDAADVAGTLGLFLELQQTTFGAILEVREVLEPQVAALAVANATAAQIEELAGSVDTMAGDLGDLDVFLTENERFHSLIAAAAGNSVFELLLGSLGCITDGSRFGVGHPVSRREHVLKAHRLIYEAIAARDADAARQAMLDHTHAFRRYTERQYPDAPGAPLKWSDLTR